jgi:DNA mismatch repair protein PMS2
VLCVLNESFFLSFADGILCLGVRFNLVDVVKKGNSYREEIKLSTTNCTTQVEQTVSSMMGSRFLSGLTRVSVDLTPVIQDSQGEWKVEGLLSKAPALTARDGSVARESQFFSINGRPVELPKVSRAIGDAWRSFEGTKKRPACVLCFTLPNSEYDVNLSPDKREVLLTHQDAICSLVFDSVTKLWSSQNNGNFATNGVLSQEEQRPSTQAKPDDVVVPNVSPPEAMPVTRRKMQRRGAFVHDFSMARLPHEVDQHELQTRHVEVYAVTPVGLNTVSANQEQVPAVPVCVSKLSPITDQVQQTMDMPMGETLPLAALQRDRPGDEERLQWTSIQSRFNTDSRRSQQDEIQALTTDGGAQQGAPITPEERLFQEPKRTTTLTLEDFAFRPNNPVIRSRASSTEKNSSNAMFASLSVSTVEEMIDESPSDIESSHRKRPSASSVAAEQVGFDGPRKRQKAQPRHTTATQDLREHDEHEREQYSEPPEKTLVWDSFQGTDSIMKATKEARFSMRQFRKELRDISRSPPKAGEAVVGGIDESSAVEVADDNVVSLSKQDFRRMTVIGQFNLGFILAKCRNNHLWILDQHACDEKYNFERLCATTVIHEQKLMAPMPLELSPSEESCILENMSVFEENGFRFAHDPEKPPRHRLALTALPHSGAHDGRRAVQFGKEDVHALCAMLSTEEGYSHQGGTGADGSGMYGNNAVRRHAGISQHSQGDTANKVIARLPKAIAMFASRACRGSIMIGTALSRKEMETVVNRLADVDHPWNCPHGRPTMRHVTNLMDCVVQDEQRANAHVCGPTVGVMTQATQES